MSDERAFLAAIIAAPHDSGRGWFTPTGSIEEQGRPSGPFVRLWLNALHRLARGLPNKWPAWVGCLVAPDRRTGAVVRSPDPDDVAGCTDLEQAFARLVDTVAGGGRVR